MVATLITGTVGKPIALPRPVVKIMMFDPPAASPVSKAQARLKKMVDDAYLELFFAVDGNLSVQNEIEGHLRRDLLYAFPKRVGGLNCQNLFQTLLVSNGSGTMEGSCFIQKAWS